MESPVPAYYPKDLIDTLKLQMGASDLWYITSPEYYVRMKVAALEQHLCIECGRPAPCDDPKMCRLLCNVCASGRRRRA